MTSPFGNPLGNPPGNPLGNPMSSPFENPLGQSNVPPTTSSLLESTSSHLIALSPTPFPPNKIKLQLIVGERVNNMVHELPSIYNDQRYLWGNSYYPGNYNGNPMADHLGNAMIQGAGTSLQRGIFSRLFRSESIRGLIGIIMFVLGIIGWRKFGN